MVIYAMDPYFRITSVDEFREHLVAANFISEPIQDNTGRQRYSTGAEFMQKLVFTGCSPSVNSALEDADYNQYDIELPISREVPGLITGDLNRAPICPRCNKVPEKYLNETRIIIDSRIRWLCPECDTPTPVDQLDWKRRACIASSMIIINGVHEGEAVPLDELLTDLQSYSGVSWSYCYCRGKR
jgi:hypothetical protein